MAAGTSTNGSPPGLPRIAIVGAGLASLRCTSLLLKSLPPSHITVYEARSRVGGRLHQALCGGHVVDEGPNWIHGTGDNPIMDLATATDTTVFEADEAGGDVYDREGRRMSKAEAEWTSGMVWEGIVEAMRYSEAHGTEISADESLFEWLRRRWQDAAAKGEQGFDGPPEARKRKVRDLTEESRMWGAFVGGVIERQSLRWFWMEECVEGGNVFVADTYAKILEHISRPVIESGCIRFNSEVVRVQVLDNDKGVEVTLRVGETAVFDEVICTAPLGWLKQHHKDVFHPPLPPHIQSAVENIGYGRLEKVYATFPEAWWLQSQDPHQQPSSTTVDGTATPDKDHNNNDPNRPLSIFTHLHPPSITPKNTPTTTTEADPFPSSNINIVSLAHLPEPTAHPTLLFYIYGPHSTALVTSLQNLTVHGEEYNQLVWDFIHPYLTKLPGYIEGDTRCRPVEQGLYATQWATDPFAGGGSYTNLQVGLVEGEEGVRSMRVGEGMTRETSRGGESGGDGAEGEDGEEEEEGLSRGKNPRRGGVWLAGEHTAPVVAMGTTTGAWMSGEGVARRVGGKWGFEVGD